ncbi:MAG: hypothetical protein Kow0042_16070 [Calditrichia bacterium]
MSQTVIKRHWYDGWFYALFIDSENSDLRKRLFNLIPDGSKVLDVGCGTGGFALRLARKGHQVTGVDLSEKMIRVARRRQKRSDLTNLEFINLNAVHLSRCLTRPFDCATMSFFLHEISPTERLQILREVQKVARQIIILDYHVPPPKNVWGILVRLIEFFAGRKHFAHFNDFVTRGGLFPLLAEAGFRIEESKVNRMGIFQVVSAVSSGNPPT